MSRLETATFSAAYNIALQVSLRVITFVSNAFILRYISKDILGLINVRLLLLYTTIQFTSREAFRRTCAPSNSKTNVDGGSDEDKKISKKETSLQWPEIVNVTFLTLPIAVINGLFFCTLWYTWMERPAEKLVSHYFYGIVSIYFSVIIESLAESCYIYGQRNDFIRLKVLIEGIFQLVRCLSLTASVFISPANAILGFAVAQLAASIVYTCAYYGFFLGVERLSFKQFFPNPQAKLNPHLLRTSFSFFLNTIVKQFLTEGERYVMTLFAVIGLAEQGIYDVINNLGSLPARLVFQQIEENAYLLFSSIVKREISPEKQKAEIEQSLNVCGNLVKFMFLLGLFLFTYGINCAQLALFFYGGYGLVSGEYGSLAVRLLQWHCGYIVFIALNGILESFSFAAMSVAQLQRFNLKMLSISATFILVSLVTTSRFGSEGFIMANCINILLRIVISVHFIGSLPRFSMTSFVNQCCPNRVSLASFGAIFWLVLTARRSLLTDLFSNESFWWNSAAFIIITGILTVVHISLIIRSEAELVHFFRTQVFASRRKQHDKTKIS